MLHRARQALVCCLMLFGSPLGMAAEEIPWVVRAADGTDRVGLWFFWSERCPHCLEALPFIDGLAAQNPWIDLHSLELTRDRDNAALYVRMATALGMEAQAVPAFLVCGRMLTGFDRAEGIGADVLVLAQSCRSNAAASEGHGRGSAPATAEDSLRLPVFGHVDPKGLSLPLFTLVMAGLDAFNPCAFFVLPFLLSLLGHARSRGRMLLIGGTFVMVSGLVYFLFMAAWLSLFLVVGASPMVTAVAGGPGPRHRGPQHQRLVPVPPGADPVHPGCRKARSLSTHARPAVCRGIGYAPAGNRDPGDCRQQL